jgi:tetratricopeptide (TPR) repeat protein
MQGDFEQVQLYYRKTDVARESGNRSLEVYGLINLGAMMVTQGNFSDALGYANQALNLAHKLGDRSAEAWALTYLGHANLGLGHFRNATNWFQTALKIRQSLGQRTLAMELLAGLAQAELGKNDSAAALSYVEDILSHLGAGGNLEGTEEPLRIYLTIYRHCDNRTARRQGF